VAAHYDLDLLSAAKFDEAGRQRALERLAVIDSARERPFERIVDLVAAALKAPICAISLIDGDRQWFKAQRGLQVDQTTRDVAFCNHAIRSDRPFIVENATSDPRVANNPLVTGAPNIRSYLGIPLKLADGYIAGTICVIDLEPRTFSAQQIATLHAFAKLVLGELELRTANSQDALTGVLSRGAWTSLLALELARAKRGNSDLCTLIIDLDRFSHINDLFGHRAGDMAIREISLAVEGLLRRSDFIGRLGGEELAVCLPGACAGTGHAVAERLRAAIAGIVFPAQPGLRCTASICVAALAPGEPTMGLLKRSDKALHFAKVHGRDLVCAA